MQSPLASLDKNEFHQRWLRARLAAFRKAGVEVGEVEAEVIERCFSADPNLTPEEFETKKDTLLKHVFEHSRLLAISLSKHLKLSFEPHDFQELLETSSVPCFKGRWEARPSARLFSRGGCQASVGAGSHACEYWREALDGLVVGLGETERLARHACARLGDEHCIDVIFSETGNRQDRGLKWGSIPEEMTQRLSAICTDFRDHKDTSVELKGLSAGVLYYEMKNLHTRPQCWDGQLLTAEFRSRVQGIYPGMEVKEVSPRPVLGVGA